MVRRRVAGADNVTVRSPRRPTLACLLDDEDADAAVVCLRRHRIANACTTRGRAAAPRSAGPKSDYCTATDKRTVEKDTLPEMRQRP